MKIKSIHFLSKSNIKGNKSATAVTVLLCMLVVAITVISCFFVTMTGIMSDYKNDYRSRTMYLSPASKSITEEAIKAIEEHAHVESVIDVSSAVRYNSFELIGASDPKLAEKIMTVESSVMVEGLYRGEQKQVLKGKTLDKAPVFSCLVPSIFYPFDRGEENINAVDLDYIDGRTLIGETFTVKGWESRVYVNYWNVPDVEGNCTQGDDTPLACPEFRFTVVGTYPCSYSTSGSFIEIMISEETDRLMSEMIFEESGIDLEANDHPIAVWWNTPSVHDYRIVVDSRESIPEVYDVVRTQMGYNTSRYSNDLELDDTTKLMHTFFTKVGLFITIAVLFVSVILLVQSSVNSIRERKGIIGLMKAIGYKNHQVFFSLVYEQLYMTLRAAVIGGVISFVIVSVVNYRFNHGTFKQLQYVIDWKVYFVMLVASFLIALLIPLITELLLLNKIVKIEPREAMSAK